MNKIKGDNAEAKREMITPGSDNYGYRIKELKYLWGGKRRAKLSHIDPGIWKRKLVLAWDRQTYFERMLYSAQGWVKLFWSWKPILRNSNYDTLASQWKWDGFHEEFAYLPFPISHCSWNLVKSPHFLVLLGLCIPSFSLIFRNAVGSFFYYNMCGPLVWNMYIEISMILKLLCYDLIA